MKRVAIVGATGHIGKALASHYANCPDIALALYSRRPQITQALFSGRATGGRVSHHALDYLELCAADILVNCVGIGDPANARKAGPAFYQLTMELEDRLDRVVQGNPGCLTVFMSSGAVYGKLDTGPADETSVASIPINRIAPSEWYGSAKLAAELRHRAQPERRVLDIRVFGFVSEFLDLGTQYLICDIVKALRTGTVMHTSDQDIVRDYIGTAELAELIDLANERPSINMAVDTYSLEPVSKFVLLDALRPLGLAWHIEASGEQTGRHHYWSRLRSAESLGYRPVRKSTDIVREIVIGMADVNE